MTELSKNKQLVINITASFMALAVHMAINFVLSPYIVATIGAEANGFVSFATQILGYITILTISLNSMTNRFISIAWYRGEKEKASQYFTSAFYANLFCVAIIAVPIFWTIANLEKVLNVSTELIFDVKTLFVFMSISFFMTLIFSTFSVVYYIKNSLYINSVISITDSVIQALLLWLLFANYEPLVCYRGIVALIIGIMAASFHIYFKNRLTPELVIRKACYDFNKIKELVKAGIWNSITRLGEVLSNGLDLLITNLFIDGNTMGVLAIAKLFPTVVTQILSAMVSSFVPNLTKLYALGEQQKLVHEIKFSMKIVGMLLNVPICLTIVFADTLLLLLYPSVDNYLVYRLAVITIMPWAIIGPASIIHNIFTIVNRIKTNSLLVCFTGLLNVMIVFLLLKHTQLGIYAVVISSAGLSIVRNSLYTVPFGAIYIKEKWYTFYPEVIKATLSVVLISSIGIGIRKFGYANDWKSLILYSILLVAIAMLVNFYVIFNRAERSKIVNLIKSKFNIRSKL